MSWGVGGDRWVQRALCERHALAGVDRDDHGVLVVARGARVSRHHHGFEVGHANQVSNVALVHCKVALYEKAEDRAYIYDQVVMVVEDRGRDICEIHTRVGH